MTREINPNFIPRQQPQLPGENPQAKKSSGAGQAKVHQKQGPKSERQQKAEKYIANIEAQQRVNKRIVEGKAKVQANSPVVVANMETKQVQKRVFAREAAPESYTIKDKSHPLNNPWLDSQKVSKQGERLAKVAAKMESIREFNSSTGLTTDQIVQVVNTQEPLSKVISELTTNIRILEDYNKSKQGQIAPISKEKINSLKELMEQAKGIEASFKEVFDSVKLTNLKARKIEQKEESEEISSEEYPGPPELHPLRSPLLEAKDQQENADFLKGVRVEVGKFRKMNDEKKISEEQLKEMTYYVDRVSFLINDLKSNVQTFKAYNNSTFGRIEAIPEDKIRRLDEMVATSEKMKADLLKEMSVAAEAIREAHTLKALEDVKLNSPEKDQEIVVKQVVKEFTEKSTFTGTLQKHFKKFLPGFIQSLKDKALFNLFPGWKSSQQVHYYKKRMEPLEAKQKVIDQKLESLKKTLDEKGKRDLIKFLKLNDKMKECEPEAHGWNLLESRYNKFVENSPSFLDEELLSENLENMVELKKLRVGLEKAEKIKEKGVETRREFGNIGAESVKITIPDRDATLDGTYISATTFKETLKKAGAEIFSIESEDAEISVKGFKVKEDFEESIPGKALQTLGLLQGAGYTRIRTEEGYLLVPEEDAERLLLSKIVHLKGEEDGSQVYFFDPSENESVAYTLSEIKPEEGQDERGTVVVTLGNAGVYEMAKKEMLAYLMQGMNVMGVNFEGYGESTGKPSGEALKTDMKAVYNFLKQEKGVRDSKLLLKALCMSGGPAAALVKEHPDINICLDQSYANFEEVVSETLQELVDKYVATLKRDTSDTMKAKIKNAFVDWGIANTKTLVKLITKLVAPKWRTAEELVDSRGQVGIIVVDDDEIMGNLGDEKVSQAERLFARKMERNPKGTNIAIYEMSGDHATSWLNAVPEKGIPPVEYVQSVFTEFVTSQNLDDDRTIRLYMAYNNAKNRIFSEDSEVVLDAESRDLILQSVLASVAALFPNESEVDQRLFEGIIMNVLLPDLKISLPDTQTQQQRIEMLREEFKIVNGFTDDLAGDAVEYLRTLSLEFSKKTDSKDSYYDFQLKFKEFAENNNVSDEYVEDLYRIFEPYSSVNSLDEEEVRSFLEEMDEIEDEDVGVILEQYKELVDEHIYLEDSSIELDSKIISYLKDQVEQGYMEEAEVSQRFSALRSIYSDSRKVTDLNSKQNERVGIRQMDAFLRRTGIAVSLFDAKVKKRPVIDDLMVVSEEV